MVFDCRYRYYILHLVRVLILFLAILLIGVGFGFIKHALSRNERLVFLVVLPLQVYLLLQRTAVFA